MRAWSRWSTARWRCTRCRAASARRSRLDETGAKIKTDSYLDVLRDRRYVLFLLAAFFNTMVYMQYLSTLPLDIEKQGVALLWYTVAVALNGAIVIAFELPLTKISQHWPVKISIGSAFLLVGFGMASYGLPMGPAVVVFGTLIWTTGEIVGAPALFAYPAMAGPTRLKGRYIGSFQFVFASGSALGPVVGGLLFTALGHKVWPVVALGSFIGAAFVALSVRQPAKEAEVELVAPIEIPEPGDPGGRAADHLISRPPTRPRLPSTLQLRMRTWRNR